MFILLPCDSILLLPVSAFPPSLPAYIPVAILIDKSSNSKTRHKTLEEIAAAFGDELILPTENDVAAEMGIMEDKAQAGHVELARPVSG